MPPPSGPTTPNWQRHQALPPARFRLFPFRSPLLRESLLLSFPPGTEMFQFPEFPPPALCVQTGVTLHDECRVSPFGYPRIKAWSAAPRGFSQPPTSFIGIRRQGIHRWLFVAWKNKDARARYAVLKGPIDGTTWARIEQRTADRPESGRQRTADEGGSLKTEQRARHVRVPTGPRAKRLRIGSTDGRRLTSASTGSPCPAN